uniref:Uncharacterized protein n=1 Tax=Panagrellus redivivus TaxID=6233 RepID=A0A7E4VPW1_PANRE
MAYKSGHCSSEYPISNSSSTCSVDLSIHCGSSTCTSPEPMPTHESWPLGVDITANDQSSVLTDSSPACCVEVRLNREDESSTIKPRPTHEIWPLKPEHVLKTSRLSIGELSTENVDKKYPSSLIALKPIHDAWQRVQNEPWCKPTKKTGGSFDPFFY